MSVTDEAKAVMHADELARARRLADEYKAELAAERKLCEGLRRELGILDSVGHRSTPPKWLSAPPKSTKKHHGTPWLLLSDLHLDEVVLPAELMGVNAYNREIAELRLAETFRSTVKISRDYWDGIIYDGIVVALGGDTFSGLIHEELKETNADTILGSLDYWVDPMVAGIKLLADTYGKVHVPSVPGNHGRYDRKPRAKFRARANFDWFFARAIARQFADDKRVTFDVGESMDCYVPSYDKKVLLTHGDQSNGGNGIAGIWSPISMLDARKGKRNATVGLPYDLLVMGHWHSLIFGPGWIVNGAMKGYDEYAWSKNYGFEPPSQALWLMTPEHGKTWTAPIYPCDRALEGW